jgi:hypothetical protein
MFNERIEMVAAVGALAEDHFLAGWTARTFSSLS